MPTNDTAFLFDSARRKICLSDGEFIFGRSPDADLVIDDQKVSRHHAKIRRRGSRFTIMDLQSRNGTFVNGKKVLDEVSLFANDRISIIGKYYFLFQDSDITLTGTTPQFSLGIVLDTRTGNVWIENTLISPPLSPNCFRLLVLLCQDPGRLYSYEEIHRFIWPDLEYYGESDRNRCHVVKKQLLDVLRKYSPRVNCVRVVSKRGMRLIDPNECE